MIAFVQRPIALDDVFQQIDFTMLQAAWQTQPAQGAVMTIHPNLA
jgi:hypothetical protein